MNFALPAEARQKLVPYSVLVMFAAAARSASALILVPLLGTIYTDGPGAAVGWLGALAASVLAGWIAEMRLMGYGFEISYDTAANTNERLVDHLLAIPIGEFSGRRQAEAKRALTGPVAELFSAAVNLGGQMGIAIVMPFMIGIGLLFVAWPLGLAAILAAPVLVGALLYGARLMRNAEEGFSSASEEAAERTDEFSRAQTVLRAAGRTGIDGTALGRAIDIQRQTSLHMAIMTIPGTLLFTLMMQAVLVGMIAVIAWIFANGSIDAARTVALIVVVTRYVEPFKFLSDLFPAIESARGAWRRTADVLALPRLPSPTSDATPEAPSIELKSVRFEPNGSKILQDVSFLVEPGTTTAIVGPSGSGKSTILSLIARFRDADAGQVIVSGHDVRQYLPATLISQLAIVFQNVQLFEGSIIENIRIAKPDATDDEIKAAAKVARVDEIVARLGGWETQVGEGGLRLSGGERQRVSLARALLKDAPILLLDEATSSLDPGNETAIASALKGFRNHTVLIVAHRMETIAHADNIIFVEAGSIVEAGSREALIEKQGRFADYWLRRREAREWRLAE